MPELNRLAEYEDTGLSPAEVEVLKHRAEVAEEALRELIAEMYENGIRPICNQEMLYETRLEQAEERLKERNNEII